MSYTIDSYGTSNRTDDLALYNSGLGQSFTGKKAYLTGARFYIAKRGNPSGNAYVELYTSTGVYGASSNRAGTLLATSDSKSVSSMSAGFTLVNFTFTGLNQIKLVDNTKYVLIVKYLSGSSSNCIRSGADLDSSHSGIAITTSGSGGGLTSGSDKIGTIFYADGSAYASIQSTASGGGTGTVTFEMLSYAIGTTGTQHGTAVVSTVYQGLAQKEYEYRVFTKDYDYIGTWQNVTSDFGYSQSVNENASELSVKLARSPDNRTVSYDTLKDENYTSILDENNDPIILQTETANAVGEGTDVDLNYNVDVYAFYGGYDELMDEHSETIIDEHGDPILSQYGYPSGRRVYSGYIADYQLTYGGQDVGVEVTVVPHATEMSHYIFTDAGNTTVKYLNTDPVLMARNAMDKYNSDGGVITYTAQTMPLSGGSVDYDFKLQTTRETVDKTIDLLSSGWYQYVHPGEKTQYLLQKSVVADHTFIYEKHIQQLELKRTITQLVNKVYFTGGKPDGAPTTDPDLFKYYEDTTSITNFRPGLDRISDSRVTLADSASILSNREIEEFKSPRYKTSVTISDSTYDIEDIRLGDMVSFSNFGSFVDTLLLQIVSVGRNKHTIDIDLDMTLPKEAKRLEELKKAILSEQIRNIDDAPS